MSWTPLQFTHGAGTRTVLAYAVPARARQAALTPVRARGGGVRVLGDGLEVPTPLVVTAEVPAASLAAAYALAYAIVAEAETATSVRTHEGDVGVRALLGYAMTPEAASVLLTLRWAPSGAAAAPLVPLAYASEASPTVDSALPTAGSQWVPL